VVMSDRISDAKCRIGITYLLYVTIRIEAQSFENCFLMLVVTAHLGDINFYLSIIMNHFLQASHVPVTNSRPSFNQGASKVS
jgi:hypothetical protein